MVGSRTRITWDWHEGPLKPPLEAFCLVPGTQGVDMVPAVVVATLVLYIVPVIYCSYPHGVWYFLHCLLAGCLQGATVCAVRMDAPCATLLS